MLKKSAQTRKRRIAETRGLRGIGLEGGFAAFVVADADGFVDAADEDLSVADAASAGCAFNGFNDFVL